MLWESVALWQVVGTLGVLLCFLELFVPGFILLPIGIGFLLATPFCAFFSAPESAFLAIALSEIAVFAAARKFRPTQGKEGLKTGSEGLIGQNVHVLEAISPSQRGYVQLYGDRWVAYTDDPLGFHPGDRAEIVGVDGNKVKIKHLTK